MQWPRFLMARCSSPEVPILPVRSRAPTSLVPPEYTVRAAPPHDHARVRVSRQPCLPDGAILLAGGFDGKSDLDTAEIFDPGTGRFTVVAGTMTAARSGHVAILLPDNNQVLIA